MAKIPATDLDCPKCGWRTAAGKKFDLDKKWNSPEKKAAAKREAQSFNAGIVFIFVAVIASASLSSALLSIESNTRKNED